MRAMQCEARDDLEELADVLDVFAIAPLGNVEAPAHSWLDRDVDQMLEKRRWMLARQAERAVGDSARVRVVAPVPAAPGGER